MIIAPKCNKQQTNQMNDPIEIPSPEQIEQMERQPSQAVEALQITISDNNSSVKCQRCSNAIPIVGKLPHQHNNDRIAVLRNRIRFLESQYHGRQFGNVNERNQNLKLLKEELAELLKEDAEYDKLRGLPLYSTKTTEWKFVCSPAKNISMISKYAISLQLVN